MSAWELDLEVARRASVQRGLVTRAQLLELGMDASGVARRVRAGLLIAVGGGVYALPSAVRGWRMELQGALLRHSAPGVVSHRSAPPLHRWPGWPEGPVELTLLVPANYRAAGMIHRAADFEDGDVVEVDGLAVTAPVRTVIDLAAVLRKRRLEWLVDDLLAANTFSLEELADRFIRIARRGKPGVANLRMVIEDRGPGYVPPASRLERLLSDVLTRGGLPAPVRQHPLPSRAGPGRVDLAYPQYRLLIEADSRRWHTRVADFEVDRQRDNEATVLRWSILRYTWKRLTDDPAGVVAEVRSCVRRAA